MEYKIIGSGIYNAELFAGSRFEFVEAEDESSIVAMQAELDNKPTCPMCGATTVMIAGHCFTCYECGYSLCSL